MQHVDRQNIEQGGEIFGQAFADYPLFTHTLRDARRRHASLPLTWRALIRQFLATPHGALDLAERDGRPVGVALWGDGNQDEISWIDIIRHGFLHFALVAGIRDALRLMKVQEHVEKVHEEIITEPHLYLVGLSTLPGAQGTGVGSELLTTGLARADALHLPVYLETNLARNVPLYERFGFVVERHESPDGLETWSMLRPAR